MPATVPVPLISNAAFRKLAPHHRDLVYVSRPAAAVGSLSLDIAQDRVISNAVLRVVALLAPLLMDLGPASPLPAAVASPLQAIAQAELIINAVFLSLAPLQRALEHARIQVKVVLAEALLPVHALATAPLSVAFQVLPAVVAVAICQVSLPLSLLTQELSSRKQRTKA